MPDLKEGPSKEHMEGAGLGAELVPDCERQALELEVVYAETREPIPHVYVECGGVGNTTNLRGRALIEYRSEQDTVLLADYGVEVGRYSVEHVLRDGNVVALNLGPTFLLETMSEEERLQGHGCLYLDEDWQTLLFDGKRLSTLTKQDFGAGAWVALNVTSSGNWFRLARPVLRGSEGQSGVWKVGARWDNGRIDLYEPIGQVAGVVDEFSYVGATSGSVIVCDVVDEFSAPVEGAAVFLWKDDESPLRWRREVFTENGKAAFRSVSPGRYQWFAFHGGGSATGAVDVTSGVPATVRVDLVTNGSWLWVHTERSPVETCNARLRRSVLVGGPRPFLPRVMGWESSQRDVYSLGPNPYGNGAFVEVLSGSAFAASGVECRKQDCFRVDVVGVEPADVWGLCGERGLSLSAGVDERGSFCFPRQPGWEWSVWAPGCAPATGSCGAEMGAQVVLEEGFGMELRFVDASHLQLCPSPDGYAFSFPSDARDFGAFSAGGVAGVQVGSDSLRAGTSDDQGRLMMRGASAPSHIEVHSDAWRVVGSEALYPNSAVQVHLVWLLPKVVDE